MQIQEYNNTFENPFFIATVTNNNDPTFNYRVKVRIEILHDSIKDEDLPWAARVGPTFMGFGNADIDHAVPEVGTKVLVLAVANDPNSLLYLGTLYKNNSITPSGDQYLGSYGIYTKNGEFIGIDKIKQILTLIWKGSITINNGGNITIENGGNLSVTINGGNTTLKSANVKIDGEVNITGALTVNKTITSNDSITATTGNITASAGDVKATAISLLNHKHGGVFPGPNNTTPPLS